MPRILLTIAFIFLSFSVSADENTFSSPTVGFTLKKPTAWHFVSANTYLEQMKQIKWGDAAEQERWNSALRAPIVVISEYPPKHNGLNSSFKVDAKPYGAIPSGLSGSEILANLIPVMQQRFKNFHVDIEPTERTLGNQKAGYFKATYVSTSTTGIDVKQSSEMWVVPMKYYLFMIGATYGPESKKAATEIQRIAQSISIE